MNDASRFSSDDLLARLLHVCESTGEWPDSDETTGLGASTPHVADETLAQFAAGELMAAERPAVVEHLDRCPACRRAASALLQLAADDRSIAGAVTDVAQHGAAGSHPLREQLVALTPGWTLDDRRLATWAVAATLLIAAGLLLVWSSGGGWNEAGAYRSALAMVEKGRFDAARKVVADANEKGIASDRLLSLDAESVRHIPAENALAYAGRLADFGFEPGGVAAREPAAAVRPGLLEAEQILDKTGQSQLTPLLNRGHLALSLNEPKRARAEFAAAVRLDPQSAWAHLGLGLAAFMLDDFAAAAKAFGKATELDPQNRAASINLALTLEELNQPAAALAQWRKLSKESLTDTDRRIVDQAFARLGAQADERQPNP